MKSKASADERPVGRTNLAARFEASGQVQDGKLPIRGTANTYAITIDGRMILPGSFDRWLSARGEASVPLLARHGLTPTFPNIGKVERLWSDAQGLHFEGWIGSGTALADEAQTLVKAKMLDQLSVSVNPREYTRYEPGDADMPADIAAKMRERKLKVLYAYGDCDLIEISLVEVGADQQARVAAAGGGLDAEQMEELVKRAVREALGGQETMTLETAAERMLSAADKKELLNAVVQTVEIVLLERDPDYARELLSAEIADAAGECSQHAGTAQRRGDASAQGVALERIRATLKTMQ